LTSLERPCNTIGSLDSQQVYGPTHAFWGVIVCFDLKGKTYEEEKEEERLTSLVFSIATLGRA
jgi:hypothetical protein